jgi:hypothetical protein
VFINAWHDRCILAGSDIYKEISNNLKKADIILLLISYDFIASVYCYDNEMKYAMEKHNKGEAVIIPVILRPCDWQDTPNSIHYWRNISQAKNSYNESFHLEDDGYILYLKFCDSSHRLQSLYILCICQCPVQMHISPIHMY